MDRTHPTKSTPPNWRLMCFRAHGKIHTLSISPIQTKFIIALLTATILGFTSSLYLNYHLNQKLHVTQQNLRNSQRLLFDYQSQTDGIYEAIYPYLHSQPLATRTATTHLESVETQSNKIHHNNNNPHSTNTTVNTVEIDN